MKEFYTKLLIFYFLVIVSFQLFSQKEEKSVQKINRLYEKGSYKRAYALSNKLKIKFTSDTYKPFSYLLIAKSGEAYGIAGSIDSNINLGLQGLQVVKKTDPLLYINGLKLVAQTYTSAGNHRLAAQIINRMIAFADSANLTDSTLRLNNELLLANNLIERGFLNEGIQIIDNQINSRKFYATQSQRMVDGKVVSITKKNKKLRKKEYGNLLSIRASAYLKKGAYKVLDSLMKIDYKWVTKNVGGNSIEARDLLYTLGNKYELLNEKRKATKTYLKAFHKSKAKFSEKKVLDILEKVIYSYNAENDRHRGRKYYRKFESALTLEYGKRNPNFLRYDLADVHINYMFSKFDKSFRKLNKINKNKLKPLPNSNLQLRMLDYSYKLNTKRSDYDPAMDSLIKIVTIKKDLLGSEAPDYHKALLELANFYALYQSKFIEAQRIEDESWVKIVAPQLSGENIDFVKYLEQLASLYDLTDKYDKAIEQLKSASNEVSKYYGTENSTYATTKQKTADEYIKKGDFNQAESTINESVEIMKKVAGRENAANQTATYTTLAKLYSTLGKYDEAEQALKKAKRSGKKAKFTGTTETSRSADELADFYIKNGRYNDAENLLDKALYLKTKRFGPNSRELIVSLNQFAQLYLIKGNYSGAEKHIRKSFELSSKIFGDSSVKITEVLKLKEELYKKIGEFIKAEETSLHILAIQKKILGLNHIDLAATYANIALLKFYATNDPAVSIIFLNEAIRIVKANLGTDNPQYATQATKLATLYLETKKYEKADSLLNESNKTWVRLLGEKNVNTAEINYLQGIIYYRKGDMGVAEQKFIKARSFYKSIFSKSHPGYVKSSSQLAHTYFVNKNYGKANKIMDEILSIYIQYTKNYFPSLSFNEKSKYWNLIKDDFEFYNNLAIKMNNGGMIAKMYNYTMSTKAILLSSSIKVRERIMNSKDEVLIERYNDWVAKKELLSSVISLSTETQKQIGIDVQQLEKEITFLEKELSESSELFASNADKKTFTWKDVKKSLKNDEYAIEIIRLRNFNTSFTDSIIYAALIVSEKSGKAPEIVIIPEGKNLESKYLKYYRNATKNQFDETSSYDNYWKLIKSKIQDSALVFISADGVYNQVNLEALKSESGTYAIDKNDFVLVSNTKDVVISRSRESQNIGNKAVLCGNPTFYVDKQEGQNNADGSRGVNFNSTKDIKLIKKTDVISKEQQRDFRSNESISQLAGTEIEINQLNTFLTNQKWSIRKFMGNNADEDSIKSIRSPRVFHIATHGFFKEDVDKTETLGLSSTETEFTQNPLLRSGLLLKGAGDVLKSNSILDLNSEKGVLTAYEAMNLNLDNTELVILSACETGLGEVQVGEGVFGLQRSFVVAGSNTVVMSLFKVNDEVTQKLMNIFYEKWLISGDKRKAFSDAKKEIKKQYPQPIYWGSFVMSGI
ncbi:MAG: CHAT domain-containing protein [Bacteroidota bacterium]|nr:CHAT domain-containing protein [Bacteroidota bacterium]